MAGKEERVRERIFLAHKKANEFRDFTIELSLEYRMHNEEWEGVCDQLGVAANSDTLDETKEILRDLILLQLAGAEEMRDIHEYLAEDGVAIRESETPEDAASNFHILLATTSAGA